jgi:crotonobetainyl-CoA:carnitine CoA-transferase CaiB-like acyl-CoA transferase
MSGVVPCGPVNTLDDVLADPQVQWNESFFTIDHPVAGPIRGVANPIRFPLLASRLPTAPPGLGEHTKEVLAQLAYDGTGEPSLEPDPAVTHARAEGKTDGV